MTCVQHGVHNQDQTQEIPSLTEHFCEVLHAKFFSGIPNYFRNSDITPEEASSRGLLARDKGRKGFAIGQNASDDLDALYRSGKIAESKAAAR